MGLENLEKIPINELVDRLDKECINSSTVKKVSEAIMNMIDGTKPNDLYKVPSINIVEKIFFENAANVDISSDCFSDFMLDNTKLYYINQDLRNLRENEEALSLSFTTSQVNSDKSTKNNYFNSFLISNECKEDKYLLNVLTKYVSRKINNIVYDIAGIDIYDSICESFIFKDSSYAINHTLIGYFIFHIYYALFETLKNIVYIEPDHFKYIYKDPELGVLESSNMIIVLVSQKHRLEELFNDVLSDRVDEYAYIKDFSKYFTYEEM